MRKEPNVVTYGKPELAVPSGVLNLLHDGLGQLLIHRVKSATQQLARGTITHCHHMSTFFFSFSAVRTGAVGAESDLSLQSRRRRLCGGHRQLPQVRIALQHLALESVRGFRQLSVGEPAETE